MAYRAERVSPSILACEPDSFLRQDVRSHQTTHRYGSRRTEKSYLFRERGLTDNVPSDWLAARPENPTVNGTPENRTRSPCRRTFDQKRTCELDLRVGKD